MDLLGHFFKIMTEADRTLAFLKYDTFHSKKKSEVTTLLLGSLLTIPADFLHPMTKYMLATGL